MLTFRQKVEFEKVDKIVLYYGQNEAGPFIAYLRCKKDEYAKVMADTAAGIPGEASQYGEVIYIDNIAEPDEKAKEFLAKYIADNK